MFLPISNDNKVHISICHTYFYKSYLSSVPKIIFKFIQLMWFCLLRNPLSTSVISIDTYRYYLFTMKVVSQRNSYNIKLSQGMVLSITTESGLMY